MCKKDNERVPLVSGVDWDERGSVKVDSIVTMVWSSAMSKLST